MNTSRVQSLLIGSLTPTLPRGSVLLRIQLSFLCFFIFICYSFAQQTGGTQTFSIENAKIKCSVIVDHDMLVSDRLEVLPAWVKKSSGAIETDADFAVDVMYTDWSAPGKVNNADNPVLLRKNDFAFVKESSDTTNGTKEMVFYFKAKETTIELLMTYKLEPDAFYARRNIAVMDTAFSHHFLRWMWPRKGTVDGVDSIVKGGDFGQPVAFLMKSGGGFFGLEYPTSDNKFEQAGNGKANLRCGQEFGQIIGSKWIPSEWVVEALTPDSYVKNWFFNYVNDIRVAPLRPYTLYNSWYDLRSPEYPKVPPEHIMSEESAMKMVKLLKDNMIEKHNIPLDACVLDDGWDVYESDWQVRKEQWPNGFKPLADELKKTNTSLGLWMGPTGGYSFRLRRVNWMQDHGYEVVGKTKDNKMLCLAGTKYSALFKKRVTDFVENDGMGYFKWDGIQFSCSELDHGHPIDIYSRRAVMESVIDKCHAVREKNPNVFLNITSGTWLSPWWVKYANTIWMQGEDYGYSDVPSLSQRDGAITYRDFILYDDFKNQDFWFPVANLMTHGIIKGKLELLGSPEEPLDKFTDDALLYFARGISMYELYISPDILSDGEWNSLSTAITWAKDRFPILTSSAYMIGGNPMKREPYGYVHFKGKNGIIAARNPFILEGKINVDLSVAQGLDPTASSLVIEKVYPTKWVAPKLYKAGDRISLPLDGYEMAVYEVYPVEEATEPLIGGSSFDVLSQTEDKISMRLYGSSKASLLNPSFVQSMSIAGKTVADGAFTLPEEKEQPVVSDMGILHQPGKPMQFVIHYTLSSDASEAQLAILLTPDSSLSVKKKPSLEVFIDSNKSVVKSDNQEGKSQWYTIATQTGKHTATVTVEPAESGTTWSGKVVVYCIAQQKQNTSEVGFVFKNPVKQKPQPPKVWKSGEIRKNVKVGEIEIK